MKKTVEDILSSLPSFSAAMHNIECKTAEIHSKLFPQLRQELQNKEVALVASGPTVKFYRPIENVLHIGINSAFFNKHIHFNYYFINDYINYFFEAMEKLLPQSCAKYYGYHVSLCYATQTKIKENLYYTNYLHQTENIFTKNIDTEVVSYAPTIAIGIMQILLWCRPRKIYLVGTDCSGGWYIGNNFYGSLTEDWKLLKNFKEKYYPDVEIESINPRGLLNVFPYTFQNRHAVDALDYRDRQDLDQAISSAQQALEEDPDNKALHILLADILLAADRPAEADALLEEQLNKFPDWNDGWLQKAATARKNNSEPEALEYISRVLQRDPQNIQARIAAAQIYYEQGKSRLLEETLTAPGCSQLIHDAWGHELMAMGDRARARNNFPQALRYYQDALAASPEDTLARTYLVRMCLQYNKNLDLAEKYVREGLHLDRRWIDGYRLLCDIFCKQKKFYEALRYITVAIKMEPYSYSTWRPLMAGVLGGLKKNTWAHLFCQDFLRATTTYADPYYWDACAYKREGNLQLAEAAARKAVALVPNHEVGYRVCFRDLLAQILLEQKKYADALSIINTHLELNKTWINGYLVKSKILSLQGNADAALDTISQGLAINPTVPALRSQMASLLLHKDRDKAIETLQEGLELVPEWAEGWYQLAQIYEKKNLTAALNCMAKVPHLAPENTRLRKYYADLICRRSKKAACIEYMNILRDNPRWGEGWRCVAMLYLDRKDMRLAEHCVRRAARLLGKERWGLVAQCKVYVAARNYPAACLAVMTLIREHQHWPYSWREYALFHETFGRYLLALDAAHKAAMLGKDDAKVANVCRQIVRRARQKVSGDKAVLLKCAKIHEELRDFQEAIRIVRQALTLAPKSLPTLRQLRKLLKKEKRWGAYLWLNLKISGIRMMRKSK